jgi:hypothetical protein
MRNSLPNAIISIRVVVSIERALDGTIGRTFALKSTTASGCVTSSI